MLYFSEEGSSESTGSILRLDDGSVTIDGKLEFFDISGNTLTLDNIEEGSVFLVKRSIKFTYIQPLSLHICKSVYIGQVNPLNFY